MSNVKQGAILKCFCCTTTPVCYTVSGYDGVYHWGITPEDQGVPYSPTLEGYYWYGWGKGHKISCHKLLVWEAVSVTSNTIPSGLSGTPDHILHSNGGFRRSVGNPFWVEGPSGSTPLSSEPYWFSACQRGGFETGASIAYVPSGSELNTMWGGSPVPNGTYKLLVGVHCFRRYKRDTLSGGVDTIVSEANGRFRVSYLGLQST